MILYLFALVGDVLDLNCNCSIAALISGFDNDSNLCPIAFKFHAVVGIFDLSNFFRFFIKVSLQSAFFVDMFLFSRKAFATIVAFLP